MFARLPDKPDHDALERAILELWDREQTFSRLREQNAGGPRFSFVDGPVTANRMVLGVHTAWGRTLKDVFQRYKALRGLPPALPERLRLPGALDRGRSRAPARAQLEARDRGVRPGGVRATLPRGGREVLGGADGRLDPARPVDGLGERLLHVQRHEHRVHLAVPEADARARSGVHGSSLDRVVPALRHVALAARADPVGRLPGPRRPVAHRSLPAHRPHGRVARDLDDDAVDAPRQRRRRRAPRGALRPARERRVGHGRAVPRRDLRGGRARIRARRPPVRGPVRHAPSRRARSSIA